MRLLIFEGPRQQNKQERKTFAFVEASRHAKTNGNTRLLHDRQTDTQTDSQTVSQPDRQTDRQTETDRQIDRQLDTQKASQLASKPDRQTDREKDRQLNKMMAGFWTPNKFREFGEFCNCGLTRSALPPCPALPCLALPCLALKNMKLRKSFWWPARLTSSHQPSSNGWPRKTTRLDRKLPQPESHHPGVFQSSQATVLEL